MYIAGQWTEGPASVTVSEAAFDATVLTALL